MYEGEHIDLKAEEMFDQLDLKCSVDSKTVPAIVLNSTTVRCPYDVLKQVPGIQQGKERDITIRSDSLHEKLTPGVYTKVAVEAHPVPTVASFAPHLISYESTQSINLTMSGPVLPRQVAVIYNSNDVKGCTLLTREILGCELPSDLSKAASVSVQLWPEGPVIKSNFSIPGRPLPQILDAIPKVLIAGVLNQTIDLLGVNFEQSQPAVHTANLSSGLPLGVTPLSDNRLRVHTLPPMPFPKQHFYKTAITFEESTGMLGHPRDLLVISQPIPRAVSPTVLYETAHLNMSVHLKVQEPLVPFVNYTCFLYTDGGPLGSPQGKLVGLHRAQQVNNRMLRCLVHQNEQ